MKRAGRLALALVVLPLTLHAAPSIVILGGKIFTNDPARPFAQALAIEGNKIVAVGTDDQIQALALGGEGSTRRIHVGGAVVIPGINDAHTHPGVGPIGVGIGTDRDSTKANLVAGLTAAIDEAPPDVWFVGEVGRAIMLDETVNRALLDQLAPNRKVLLRSFVGHGTIVSSSALKAAGIADNVTDPPGGRYGRNPDGTLNGRVFEYAEYALNRKIARMTAVPGDLVTALQDFSNQALRFGITSIQAMPFDVDDVAFTEALAQAGIPLRVRHISVPLSLPTVTTPPRGTNGVKWVLDGTPLEKGAAVRTPYPDGGGSGTVNFTSLAPLINAGIASRQQLLFHASGDRAIATLLKAMAATPSVNWPSLRPRIEHADGLHPDLDAQAKSLGVVAVLNPSHFEARPLFPQGRFMRAKSLLAIPIRVALGSDGPLNPYLNILLATNRPDLPSEALSREEAVAAYTLGSAFAEKADDKGVLAPGKLADLAVLSQDIFKCSPEQLLNTVSILTIINGKVVLDQPAPAP